MQPLDQTRFAVPDFAPGEEQRLADRERAWEQLSKRVYAVIDMCEAFDFGDDEWTVLAMLAVDQLPFADPRVKRLFWTLSEMKEEIRRGNLESSEGE